MRKLLLILPIVLIYFGLAIITEIRFANEFQNSVTHDVKGWFCYDLYFDDSGENILLLRWDRIFILVVSLTFGIYKLVRFIKQKKEPKIKLSRMNTKERILIAALISIYFFACFISDNFYYEPWNWDETYHTQIRHLFYNEHIYYANYTHSIEIATVYKWDRIFVAMVTFAIPIYYLRKRPFRYSVKSYKSKKDGNKQ